MESVLHNFLDKGLLDIGEDDEKFKFLQKTSQDLVKRLLKKKSEIIPFVLVAFDSNAAPDEAVFTEVANLLKKHWTTYRNRYPDTPRQLLRAVILDALNDLGQAEPAAATIIWLVGGNYLPYAKLDYWEAGLCKRLLIQMGELAETRAVDFWTTSPSVKLSEAPQLKLEIEARSIQTPSIDVGQLAERLAAAAGPQSAQGVATTPPNNPYWPQNTSNWLDQFASIGAQGIASVVCQPFEEMAGLVSGELDTVVAHINKQLEEYSSGLNDFITDIRAQLVNGSASSERRISLLWWKETLYSPILQVTYRSLSPAASVFAMAVDLHRLVPEYCPQSVEFLLRETVREVINAYPSLSGDETLLKPIRFSEFMGELLQSTDVPAIRSYKMVGTSLQTSPTGRITLLECIERALAGDTSCAERVAFLTGIDESSEFSLDDISAWLFRDLQAKRLAA